METTPTQYAYVCPNGCGHDFYWDDERDAQGWFVFRCNVCDAVAEFREVAAFTER